jgi:outer membrane receptor protein involved in Fe transport
MNTVQRRDWLATAAMGVALAAAAGAVGQDKPASKPVAPAAKPAPKEAAVEGVVVTGAPPPVRTSIDRKSYSVSGDLQATTGSIGDALRNIPAVEVDVNGNVALRGDQNVTILIDGKPSGRFRGEGKAQALQSLPADQIDRVEVITNPSAAFTSEGTAGIINLITKKTARPGLTGSVRANLGSSGRQNGGLSLARKDGRFTTSGDLYLRHESLKQTQGGDRTFFDPASGVFNEQRRGNASGQANVAGLRGGLDFDPDAKTRISAEVDYNGSSIDIAGANQLTRRNGAGATTLAYDTSNGQRQDRDNLEMRLSYRRKTGDDREFNVSLVRELNDDDRSSNALRQFRVPASATTYDDAEYRNHFWRTRLQVDWSRPLAGEAKLKLGYEFTADDNDYELTFLRSLPPGPSAVDPNRSNLFRFDQQIHTVFATYERPLGKKLTALAGLRVEATMIDLDQVTQAQKDENDDVKAYPSLHLAYRLDETRQLSASYSHRIQRPDPQAYNSFRVFIDPQNFSQGNPDLKPQQTDSFELGYQYRRRGTIYLATAYYRDGKDAVNDVVRDIGNAIILQTKANVGNFRSAGLELVANGRLPGKISYNLSGNVLWTELDAVSLGFGSRQRSAFTEFGRGSLNWQASDKDMLQVQGSINGKRLTPQGYSKPMGVVNLGYRHKFKDNLSAVVTVQDLFATQKFRNIIETSTYREATFGKPKNRGVFVGLTYAFGGGRQRDPGFDFGGGGSPGN